MPHPQAGTRNVYVRRSSRHTSYISGTPKPGHPSDGSRTHDDFHVGPDRSQPWCEVSQIVLRAEERRTTEAAVPVPNLNPTSTTASFSAHVIAIGRDWHCS